MRALLFALLVAGCASGLQSMDWDVECGRTTVDELDARYRDEVAQVYASFGCEVGDPLPDGSMVSSVVECPAYHRTWRNYWNARRAYAACEQP